MRTLFLLLLLVCVGASLLDWEKVNILRNRLARVKADLDVDRLLAIRQKLDRYMKVPKPDSQQQAHLAQRLKMLKPINVTRSDSIDYINEDSGIADLLYQGDMILTEEQADELIEGEDGFRDRRQADVKVDKWDKVLYFSFDSTADEKMKTAARRGTKLWHDNTCIDMVEDNTASDRVQVYKGVGCNSYVGNIHKVQELSLGKGCEYFWTAAHEFGHALGLHHTQSRSDRDLYVDIDFKNIQDGKAKNFNKEETANNYGIPYDFGSRMHYDGNSFAKDTSMPTIIPHKEYEHYRETMGSPFLGFYDILLMNKHYGCLDKCESKRSAAKCQMGGYPNPRDCSKCICPRGYGGAQCNERPRAKKCGETLTALPKANTISYTVGDMLNSKEMDDFEECYYWIQNPEKKTIKLTIKNLEVKYMDSPDADSYSVITSSGCSSGGVEIKAQKDQLMSGYRFCDPEGNVGKTITSSNEVVPIIIYNRLGATELELEYRTV